MATTLEPATMAGQTTISPALKDGREVEVFYDHACPLCRREIAMLRWMDRKNRIQFTDITSPTFVPSSYGLTMDDFMSEIQGRLPDGSFITGVEVFRRLYGAVGLRWLIPLTRIPGISHLLDFGYRVFAKNRLRFTGRCTDQCELPNQTDSVSQAGKPTA